MNSQEQADTQSLSARLDWLRAGVLGANDGIVSTAGLVFGVAGATTDSIAVLVAGLAGVVAGSLSMAGGEFVSVSSQRDSGVAALAAQRAGLAATRTASSVDSRPTTSSGGCHLAWPTRSPPSSATMMRPRRMLTCS